jgi:putative SOS response-associated peptidase YedK
LQVIPIARPADDGRELVLARWGLVPSGVKDLKISYECFNAEAETVDTTSAYRAAFKSRRRFIPPMGSMSG